MTSDQIDDAPLSSFAEDISSALGSAYAQKTSVENKTVHVQFDAEYGIGSYINLEADGFAVDEEDYIVTRNMLPIFSAPRERVLYIHILNV